MLPDAEFIITKMTQENYNVTFDKNFSEVKKKNLADRDLLCLFGDVIAFCAKSCY